MTVVILLVIAVTAMALFFRYLNRRNQEAGIDGGGDDGVESSDTFRDTAFAAMLVGVASTGADANDTGGNDFSSDDSSSSDSGSSDSGGSSDD